MNKKTILKVFILPGTSLGLVAGTAIPLSLITVSAHDNGLVKGLVDKATLQNRILNESYKGGEQKFYQHDDLIFDSEQELNKYILNKGDVRSMVISSDPIKIVKNYEEWILDENQIYDTNIKNFVQIFEDPFGDVTFNAEDALKAYIHGGNVRQQYSYDGINWYNSTEEAKNAAKREMKIYKSLYYVYNNKYYNAFNTNDINDLLANMLNGYYTQLDKNLDGTARINLEEIFGDKETFGKLLKEKLSNDFKTNYYKEVTSADIKTGLMVSPHQEQHIRVNSSIISEGKSLPLTFFHNYNSLTEMENDFQDMSKWEKKRVNDVYTYTRYFDLIINNQVALNTKLEVHSNPIMTTTSDHKVKYYPRETNIANDFNFNSATSGTLHFFKDKNQKDEFENLRVIHDGIYGVALTNDEMDKFYRAWFDNYFNNVVTDFGFDNNNRQVTWQDIKNNIFIKNKTENFLPGVVWKDKIYEVNPGKGYNYSLVKSQMDWQRTKEKLIEETDKGHSHDGNEKVYPIRKDLLVSRHDLDNFLNLEGTIDARVMYTVAQEDNSSDQSGKFLAQTEVQAKALKQLFNDDSLKIRYRVYDVYGNEIISEGSDEQSIIKELRSRIKLNSKFVHKDEVNKWPTNNKDFHKKWADLVSVGNYLAYSISNPNDSQNRIWFLSQEAALKHLKINLKPEVVNEDIYIFNFLTENEVLLPIKYKMNELDKLVNQIYRYES